jgi:hypothetical protein
VQGKADRHNITVVDTCLDCALSARTDDRPSFQKMVRDSANRQAKERLDAFVNAVFLYDDKLVLTLNWKDGTKTISLPEIESVAEAMKSNEPSIFSWGSNSRFYNG